jgi:hypothetical protein
VRVLPWRTPCPEELVDNALCKFSKEGNADHNASDYTPAPKGKIAKNGLVKSPDRRGTTAGQIAQVAYMQFERRLHEQAAPGLGLRSVAKELGRIV